MPTLSRRLHDYVERGITLARAGVTWRSIALNPLRRRSSDPRYELELKTGLTIVSPPDEPLASVFHEVWTDHRYTPGPFAVMPGQTIVDVGANVGVFALLAASVDPTVRVVAVEPSARSAEFLRRNVRANKLGNVTVLQVACGGEDAKAVLYSRGPDIYNTLYTRDVLGSRFRPLQDVDVWTLEAIFSRCGVEVCHLLKLDCEGAEYEILLNASPATLDRIRRISMEYHVGLNSHTPDELARFLQQNCFKVERTPLLDEDSGYMLAGR